MGSWQDEKEQWTSGMIVVILILLILPTVISMLGWRVASNVSVQAADVYDDYMTNMTNIGRMRT